VDLVVQSPALWQLVQDGSSAAAARNMLFSQVTKPTSGFVSRHINARVSIPTSKLLVGTGLSPHAITVVLVLTTGLASAWLITHPAPYWRVALAGLLWQLAAILDRCDGEVARVKLCESAFGAWFDTVTDNFSYLCAYVGLVVGMRHLHPTARWPLALGTSAIVALLLTLAIMYAYARRTGSGSLQHYLRDLSHEVPDAEKSWVQRLMQRYGFVAKRDFFSFVIFLALLANRPEAVFAFLVTILHAAAGAVVLSQPAMLRSAAARASGNSHAAGGRRP
jgi:phosphatidylglycerophosphate synthase